MCNVFVCYFNLSSFKDVLSSPCRDQIDIQNVQTVEDLLAYLELNLGVLDASISSIDPIDSEDANESEFNANTILIKTSDFFHTKRCAEIHVRQLYEEVRTERKKERIRRESLFGEEGKFFAHH